MVSNLNDSAKQFVQDKVTAAVTPTQDPTGATPASPFTPTALLPGQATVGMQQVPVSTPNVNTMWAYRGLDTVKNNADRIQAAFDARMSQAQMQQDAMNDSGSSGIPNSAAAASAYQDYGNLSKSRQGLLANARSYIGSDYQLGGRSYQGIDCSGLVMQVYNKMGFNITQHSAGWQGRNIPGVRTSVNNLRPGDIVAWKDGSHIAIYAGNGQIIEAANTRVGTVQRKIWADPSQIVGIKVRLPGE